MIPVGSLRFIQSLLKLKIRPLIAHPERNKAIMARPEKVNEFAEAGCWLQLTAGSWWGGLDPRHNWLHSRSLTKAGVVSWPPMPTT